MAGGLRNLVMLGMGTAADSAPGLATLATLIEYFWPGGDSSPQQIFDSIKEEIEGDQVLIGSICVTAMMRTRDQCSTDARDSCPKPTDPLRRVSPLPIGGV